MERMKGLLLPSCPFTCAKPVMDRMGIRRFRGLPLCLYSNPWRVHVNELKIVQTPIGPKFLHQLFMASDIRNCAVFKNDNPIRAPHGGKTMGNYHYGPPSHQIL